MERRMKVTKKKSVKRAAIKKATTMPKPVKRAQSKQKVSADEFVLQMPIGAAIEMFSRTAGTGWRGYSYASQMVHQRFVAVIEELRDSHPGITGKHVTLAALELAKAMLVAQFEHAAKRSPSTRKSVSSRSRDALRQEP
jgi:hypothetical protein